MNTTILALDLGTNTGWALHHLDGSIISGTECFKPQRFEGGGMRFLRFKRWLNELLSASQSINAVYFEEVRRHAGVDAAHAYRPLPPTPQAIDRMMETMRWVQWLDVEQRHLVWMRAKQYEWKVICRRFGCERTTAWRRWQRALQMVAERLNEQAHRAVVF